MDNDNKIDGMDYSKNKNAREVSLFLQEELIPLKKRKTVTSYNLEEEYAKTKKNRNYSIWIVMGITVVAAVLATWGFVSGLSAKKNVKVSLEAFEDLNLRNLFDALSKTQDLYEKASKTKAELQASLDSRIAEAKRNRDADIAYLKKMKLAKKQYQDKEREVLKRYRDRVNAAHEELDEKIQAAEIELKQYEEQLKSFDSENVAKAQTWEKEMDSQRQVHEIEKSQLTEEYENQLTDLRKQMKENSERNYQERRMAINDLTTHYEARISKLDPQIKDSKVTSVVQESADLTANGVFNPEVITQNLAQRDEEFSVVLSETKRKFDDYSTLNNYAQTIPFSNGMENVVSSERQIVYDMTNSIAKTGAERISKLKTENYQLSTQLENSRNENARLKTSLSSANGLLDTYAKSVGAEGFILNYSTGNAAVVFVSSASKAFIRNDGSSKGTVVDSDGLVLATGSFWFKDSVYFLTLDEEVESLPYGAIVHIK